VSSLCLTLTASGLALSHGDRRYPHLPQKLDLLIALSLPQSSPKKMIIRMATQLAGNLTQPSNPSEKSSVGGRAGRTGPLVP
jgi:hypothetical protein